MKINQKTISAIAVAAIVVLLMFKIVPFNYSASPDYYDGSYFKHQNKLDSLNAALRKAKHQYDSLKYAKEEYVGGEEHYSGFTGILGVGTLSDLKDKKKQNCIIFSNIGLKINENVSKSYLSFHTINGQGYLSKLRFDKSVDGTRVSVIDKKVDYRYNPRQDSVFVPFNSEPLNVLIYVIFFTLMLFLVATFLFALTTFFKFLISISKNEAFTFENTLRLKQIAIAMLLLAFSPILINGLIYLVFTYFYSSDGISFNYSFWKFDVFYLIMAILCYIMYTAFKHAMILKEESELTI
jgi:hypothetical protein